MHQLRYVLVAAEQGGFRRAARRLGVQQSAVSRRIRELEERLGALIFERGPHGVRLTKAGRDFVDGAQGAMAELDRVVEAASDAGRFEHGVLRIGVTGALGPGPLDDLLRRALAREPQITLELVEGDAAALGERLAQGRLDIAFLAGARDACGGVRVWRERLMLALPVAHPLEARTSIRWSELDGLRLLLPASDALRALAERRGLRQRALACAPQAASVSGVLRLVSLGQGVGVVAESGASRTNGVIYRPLFREFLTWRAIVGRGLPKPALRRLMSLIEQDASGGDGAVEDDVA